MANKKDIQKFNHAYLGDYNIYLFDDIKILESWKEASYHGSDYDEHRTLDNVEYDIKNNTIIGTQRFISETGSILNRTVKNTKIKLSINVKIKDIVIIKEV